MTRTLAATLLLAVALLTVLTGCGLPAPDVSAPTDTPPGVPTVPAQPSPTPQPTATEIAPPAPTETVAPPPPAAAPTMTQPPSQGRLPCGKMTVATEE